MTANVERIDVATARQHVAAGRALLVCGYEDDAQCRKGRLEGSMPFVRFEAMAASLPKTQEIIFYCA
ncbi:MAG: rhodanese-like domain-containing protein [Candidatus Rokuibacteriota bacterium]